MKTMTSDVRRFCITEIRAIAFTNSSDCFGEEGLPHLAQHFILPTGIAQV